MNKKSKLCN